MQEIQIGKITIRDIDENDRFDPKVDEVRDAQGGSIPAQEKTTRLYQALGELKAKSWVGIPLSHAAAYLQHLNLAGDAAGRGEVWDAFFNLNAAHQMAERMPFTYDRVRGDKIYQSALIQGIERNFLEAEKISQEKGEIPGVQHLLDDAQAFSDTLWQEYRIPAGVSYLRADSILKRSYQTGIPELYVQAERQAYRGAVEEAKETLSDLQKFIQEADQKFQMSFHYDQARGERALKLAYKVGIPEAYLLAEKMAARGSVKNVKAKLGRIQAWIAEVNQSYAWNLSYDGPRGDRILESAYVEGIEDNFRMAEKYARWRNPRRAQMNLDSAKTYVNEYNQYFGKRAGLVPQSFDQDRADGILLCATGAASCANIP